jgi:ABC-type lipoprotein export system ATPase subunit
MIKCAGVRKRFSIRNHPPRDWSVADLQIGRGERVLITGPSGCGKTTLQNLVAGLLRPDSGTIEVNGVRVERLSTSAADVFRGQNVGLVFQSFQLLSPLSVMSNLLLGARYGRKWSGHEAHERAAQLLERVGLGRWHHQRPSELSLGEQQRVAIARALINEPLLLLADEPTASLDASNADNVMQLLLDLCADRGTTLVTISHDTGLAPRFERVIDASRWIGDPVEVSADV